MIKALELLRNVYHFNGYIHVKAIPGADNEFITRLGHLADRMSIIIELPSQESLKLLAPNKTKESILRPMGLISSYYGFTALRQKNCWMNKIPILIYRLIPNVIGHSTIWISFLLRLIKRRMRCF